MVRSKNSNRKVTDVQWLVAKTASRRPSNPLRDYSYVHHLKLGQPCQITGTMHKKLLVTTVTAYCHLYLAVTGNSLGFSFTSATNAPFFLHRNHDGGSVQELRRKGNFSETQLRTLVSEFTENMTFFQSKHSSEVTNQKKAKVSNIIMCTMYLFAGWSGLDLHQSFLGKTDINLMDRHLSLIHI